MSDPYANVPAPPTMGNYPDRFVFSTPGQSVEGVVRDVRMSSGGTYDPCPILDIQTAQVGPDGQPICWSVFCNPTSLWRQLTALRPPVGSLVRVTFVGHEGQAKVFTLEVAPTGAGAPSSVTAPVQAPMQPPAVGFPPPQAYAQPAAQAEVPFGSAPVPTPPPWGQ